MQELQRAYAVAEQQYGALAHRQALTAGMTEDDVFRCTERGLLVPVHTGVYRIGGAPQTWYQALKCATLAAGEPVVVSHRAAASLWDLLGFERGIVEITIPYGHSYHAHGVIAHRSRRFPAVDVDERAGLAVTTVSRTLIDNARFVPADVLEEAIDEAVRRGDTSPARLRWRLKELGGPGRKGSALMRELLEEYLPGQKVPASVFERRVVRLCARAGIRRPVIRPEIPTAGGPLEVDAAWIPERVCLEADGARWHETRRRFMRDSERRALLAAAGWRVLPVRWHMLRSRPQFVVAMIRSALAAGLVA